MPDLDPTGKLLMIVGVLLFVLGAAISMGNRFFRFGRLPGDIVIQRGNFTFYFPLLTCIIISLLLSLIMKIFQR